MSKPVIVAGGAGFVGSHTCKALAAAGYQPVVFDNLCHGYEWAVQWGPLVQGDLLKLDTLRDAFQQFEPAAVLHFAGLISVGESVTDPLRYYDANVTGSLNLLQVMQEFGVKQLVFSSTAAVYGEPDYTPIDEKHPKRPENPYGWSKLLVEQMLQDFVSAYDFETIALRYFNAAGADPECEIGEAHDPETHLIPIALEAAAGLRSEMSINGDDFDTVDGTCVRDYVHVSDLANAHVRAIQSMAGTPSARAYNLGTNNGNTVREVINTVKAVTGREFPVVNKPRRSGDPAILVANADHARRELGWQPARTDLATQITDAWRWYQRYHRPAIVA